MFVLIHYFSNFHLIKSLQNDFVLAFKKPNKLVIAKE